MDIVIYGAGKRCAQLLDCLSRWPNVRVAGLADSYATGSKYGLEIVNMFQDGPKKFSRETVIVISIAHLKEAERVHRHLQDLGYENNYLYIGKTKTFSDNFLDGECLKMPAAGQLVLPSLEIHVVDFCNLNCAGCAHFSPLFEKVLPNFETRIRDLHTLKKLLPNVLVLSLLGGEPLLNPEIEKYMKDARLCFPDAIIQVITNGLLLPKISDTFFTIAHENQIVVTVSEYAPTQLIIERIKQRLELHKVDYEIRSQEDKSRFNRPISIQRDSVHEKCCISDGCVSICDGRIARCPTLLYIEKFNTFFHQKLPTNGISRITSFTNGEKLLEQMNKRVPLCDFCIRDEREWRFCGNNIVLEDFAARE